MRLILYYTFYLYINMQTNENENNDIKNMKQLYANYYIRNETFYPDSYIIDNIDDIKILPNADSAGLVVHQETWLPRQVYYNIQLLYKSGDRRYIIADIKSIGQIYHLLGKELYNINGPQKMIKNIPPQQDELNEYKELIRREYSHLVTFATQNARYNTNGYSVVFTKNQIKSMIKDIWTNDDIVTKDNTIENIRLQLYNSVIFDAKMDTISSMLVHVLLNKPIPPNFILTEQQIIDNQSLLLNDAIKFISYVNDKYENYESIMNCLNMSNSSSTNENILFNQENTLLLLDIIKKNNEAREADKIRVRAITSSEEWKDGIAMLAKMNGFTFKKIIKDEIKNETKDDNNITKMDVINDDNIDYELLIQLTDIIESENYTKHIEYNLKQWIAVKYIKAVITCNNKYDIYVTPNTNIRKLIFIDDSYCDVVITTNELNKLNQIICKGLKVMINYNYVVLTLLNYANLSDNMKRNLSQKKEIIINDDSILTLSKPNDDDNNTKTNNNDTKDNITSNPLKDDKLTTLTAIEVELLIKNITEHNKTYTLTFTDDSTCELTMDGYTYQYLNYYLKDNNTKLTNIQFQITDYSNMSNKMRKLFKFPFKYDSNPLNEIPTTTIPTIPTKISNKELNAIILSSDNINNVIIGINKHIFPASINKSALERALPCIFNTLLVTPDESTNKTNFFDNSINYNNSFAPITEAFSVFKPDYEALYLKSDIQKYNNKIINYIMTLYGEKNNTFNLFDNFGAKHIISKLYENTTTINLPYTITKSLDLTSIDYDTGITQLVRSHPFNLSNALLKFHDSCYCYANINNADYKEIKPLLEKDKNIPNTQIEITRIGRDNCSNHLFKNAMRHATVPKATGIREQPHATHDIMRVQPLKIPKSDDLNIKDKLTQGYDYIKDKLTPGCKYQGRCVNKTCHNEGRCINGLCIDMKCTIHHNNCDPDFYIHPLGTHRNDRLISIPQPKITTKAVCELKGRCINRRCYISKECSRGLCKDYNCTVHHSNWNDCPEGTHMDDSCDPGFYIKPSYETLPYNPPQYKEHTQPIKPLDIHSSLTDMFGPHGIIENNQSRFINERTPQDNIVHTPQYKQALNIHWSADKEYENQGIIRNEQKL